MEVRLCDFGELDYALSLCEYNNVGIEVQSFGDVKLFNKDNIDKVPSIVLEHKRKLKKFLGGKSLHAPFQDLNLGTSGESLRDNTMKMFNYAYKIAKELGCTEIVVHNGYIPGTSFVDRWVERAADFWKEFFQDKDDSITICIENQFESTSEILIKEIDLVNDSRLKVCLDVGHANANSRMKVEDWIKTLGERIGYFHLHNNHGKLDRDDNDEHLGLDDGTIDMDSIIKLANQHCPNAILNLEPKPKYFEESLNWMKEHGYIKTNVYKK